MAITLSIITYERQVLAREKEKRESKQEPKPSNTEKKTENFKTF